MFSSRIENTDGAILVHLKGDLDAVASKAFVADVEKILPLCSGAVTLDLSELEFISSAGLRNLLTIRKEAAELGGSVKVSSIQANVMQIFALSGFDKLFGLKG